MLKDLNRGLWDSSAAGHVDAGETYGDCAPRELKEELGVAAADLRALFKLQACPELGMEFIQVYRAEHNGPFELAADEIDEGDWFSRPALDDRVARDDDLDRNFQNHLAALSATLSACGNLIDTQALAALALGLDQIQRQNTVIVAGFAGVLVDIHRQLKTARYLAEITLAA